MTLDPVPINVKELCARCMTSAELARGILDQFQNRLQVDLEQLVRSVVAHDTEEAARLARGLKVTAADSAASRIHAITAEIERLSRSADLAETERQLALLRQEAERCLEFIPAAIAELSQTPPQKRQD